MPSCFFASDLHGRVERFAALFAAVAAERPAALFLGGDLLPHAAVANRGRAVPADSNFLLDVVGDGLQRLRSELGEAYPRVFAIFGNDDPRAFEPVLDELEAAGLVEHLHMKRAELSDPDGATPVYGCAWVPPTPFRLKDWERYDVGRGVDPGCISPEEGSLSVRVAQHDLRYTTIANELRRLAGDDDLRAAVVLFHAPPYRTALDRAALDGRTIDHVPVDVHVGSVAIQRFLAERQPRLALCGHVHEAARLTGSWRDRIGRTHILSAAHDGPELALVRFDPAQPQAATRELVAVV
jgi:Icc-related predicted phosphoesterase